ncbi:hypothetical protein DVH24_021917 [Malus domestica]|uniref:Uncharacterized protein n=1 Tax=Malus domestica TaxID=3750 RepID=A0A498IX08_MALDO|nr:hypothetical protein DVH24_021917 [Malus domestica]
MDYIKWKTKVQLRLINWWHIKRLSELKIWRPKYPGIGDKYTGLHCILQQAIEASSNEMDYEIIVPKIEVGACYEIMNFRTNMAIVPHDTHIIFTYKIVFKKLACVFPPIPRHKFFLQDYSRLYPRLNKFDILTDVIGHLIVVQPLEPIQINQRIDHKCDLVIQNIWSFQGKITLWSDVAHAFPALSLIELPQPIIVVFTNLRIKLFSSWPHSIKTLPPSSKQANEEDILQTRKKVTIEDLG